MTRENFVGSMMCWLNEMEYSLAQDIFDALQLRFFGSNFTRFDNLLQYDTFVAITNKNFLSSNTFRLSTLNISNIRKVNLGFRVVTILQ